MRFHSAELQSHRFGKVNDSMLLTPDHINKKYSTLATSVKV
jgi:hypothetical protein